MLYLLTELEMRMIDDNGIIFSVFRKAVRPTYVEVVKRSLVLMILLIASTLVRAENSKETYIIGVENVNLYPFYDFTSKPYRGYLVEMLQKFAESEGMKIEFKVLEPKDLWVAYLGNDVDFRMPDNLLWKRSRKQDVQVTYSAPISYFNSGVVSLSKDKDSPFTRMGTIKGFTAWSYKDMIESGALKLVEETGTDGLIEGLFSGRTNGVYYNVESFMALVDKAGYPSDSIVFRRELITSRSLYMMSSILHPEKIYALNQFLRDNYRWARDRKMYYGIDKI